ncbi:hypothetical protein RNAN_2681 [Rheinheimera nanhaiensis E407-8]|uniref:Uncharacterized protein n=1 Tax=Rheinheimera nanhaiensis E407-8 TaxID=562729 RepID=I1E047_9GAMM|nr:hypothetical protein RNAN_2681 [Rheinheimera nanhaiensis E407-8]
MARMNSQVSRSAAAAATLSDKQPTSAWLFFVQNKLYLAMFWRSSRPSAWRLS